MRSVCFPTLTTFICLTLVNSYLFGQSYSFETLAYPDAIETLPNDINNNGVVVGAFTTESGEFPGFPFRYEMGEFQELEFPGVPEADALGINDAGEMVGAGFDVEEFLFLAFAADTAGTVELLDIPGSFLAFPYSIDENSVITGVSLGFDDSVVFRKDGDAVEEIAFEGFGEIVFASANDNGTIVGGGILEDELSRSFVYRNGVAEPFAHPDGETQLTAVNNRETIAGQIYIDELTSRSFVFADNRFTEVAFPGATSTNISGMNDGGTLVGYYRLPDSENFHGFIATPVPEPSSALLGWFALLTVLDYARRRR